MKTIVLSIVLFISTALVVTTDFITEQKKYARVKQAYSDKEELLTKKLKEVNLDLNNINILITVFKNEGELTIYVKKKTEEKYKKLTSYQICASSGELGPKCKQGDLQVPEGFYYINNFNPVSSYYLSLGINYPNQADKIKSTAPHLGGDIFIHGECVTIGCMPMTNDKIEEIYIYAIQARQNGQLKIPVYIFPFNFSEKSNSGYKEQYQSNTELMSFWDNLKTGYDLFQSTSEEIKVSVDKNGNYNFKK